MVPWQIDVKVKILTFVFLFAAIWKGCKLVGRSKMISELNLNMVYGYPVLKQKQFYLGSDRSKLHVLFGAQK